MVDNDTLEIGCGWTAGEVALDAARNGSPGLLIERFRSGQPLSAGERDFIVELLEAKEGKRSRDNRRKIERMLIVGRYDDLIEEGLRRKTIVDRIMRQHHKSRRHVYAVLKAAGRVKAKKRKRG
jgi:hypothetical protein